MIIFDVVFLTPFNDLLIVPDILDWCYWYFYHFAFPFHNNKPLQDVASAGVLLSLWECGQDKLDNYKILLHSL